MSEIEQVRNEIAELKMMVVEMMKSKDVVVGDFGKEVECDKRNVEGVGEVGGDVAKSDGAEPGICVVDGEDGVMVDGVVSGLADASWSSQVEREEAQASSESSSSVEMPSLEGGNEGREAARKVKFLAEEDSRVSGKFFSEYVRTAAVKSFLGWLKERNVVVPKTPTQEIALSLFTQATVPDAFHRGRLRLKSMAKFGDTLLTCMLTEQLYFEDCDSAYIQSRVAALLSRSALSRCAVGSGLSGFVVIPSGVDASTSSVCGEAVEAVAAALYVQGGLRAVRSFMVALQLLVL